MRRVVWLLSALPWLCLGGAPAAHAAAAPDVGVLRQLPREVVTPVVTDGERYAVAGLAGGRRTRLFDTRRGTSRDIGNPSCVNPLAPAPEAAPPRTLVGGGRIVWQCVTYASASQLIWVQDIRSGSRFVAGGVRALWPAEIGTPDGSTFTLIGAGRHWLYAVRRGYHQSADALVGVDTARTISAPRTTTRVRSSRSTGRTAPGRCVAASAARPASAKRSATCCTSRWSSTGRLRST